MADSDGEKSQDATPHRRQQAREQGQVAQSQDLAAASLLLVGLVGLWVLGGSAAGLLGDFTRHSLGQTGRLIADPAMAGEHWNMLVIVVAKMTMPILALLLVTGILVHLMQTGFLWVPDRIMPDFSRVDPLKGLGRIFSMSGAVRLAFGMIKVSLVATVAGMSLYQDREKVLSLAAVPLAQMAGILIELTIWTSIKIAAALLILALLDYAWQWWQHEQQLRMSSDEVREEMKNLQGDPQVASRRRAVQRQLILNRLSSAVPKADVIITNPTELAIAIQYDPTTMLAPVVVAKGAGTLAQRIRRLALENGIPILERKPLAQALYKQVDVNHPVPAALYNGVAEVLAYVYQLTGKKLPQARAS